MLSFLVLSLQEPVVTEMESKVRLFFVNGFIPEAVDKARARVLSARD